MSDTAKRRSTAVRVVLALMTVGVAIMGWVAVSNPHPIHPSTLAHCVTTGEGFALHKPGARPFEADLRGFTYRGTTDNVVDLHVYLIGAWEPHVLDLMADILDKVFGGDGVVLDIGANTGVHSMASAPHAKSVHAVEPWPPVLNRMKAMIVDNKIDNIVVHPVGYAAEPGVLPFVVPPDNNLGGGSFSSDSVDGAPGDTIDLPLLRGDDDLAKHGVSKVDLIKIDIQGYEKPALEGLHDTLWNNRPFVIMELLVSEKEKLGFFSEEELRSVYPPNYEFFTIGEIDEPGMTLALPADWKLYCLDTRPEYVLKRFDMKFVDEGGVHSNLLAVPSERVGDLEKMVGGTKL